MHPDTKSHRRKIFRLGIVVHTAALPFSPKRTRALALLLLAALGLQAVPLQPVVQHLQHGATHQECTHPKGVCPMNPDGPCECDHDTPSPANEPTLESCTEDSPTALRHLALSEWVSPPTVTVPAPRLVTHSPSPDRLLLSSQRTGDDVFRPPRVEAERPARTLQAVRPA
ncbi:MAG: hypothetical protein BRD35_02525 [Bacteroidetes bacterium QH_7_62_13]|nr:MAG: hypothetical protein BRD35_02525 [Bacteroidetes bacterium QH_7_62_13]